MSWDRSKTAYREEWVPRFVPYLTDLVRELALGPRQRVLVVSSGPGVVAVAAARATEGGLVRALDPRPPMIELALEQARAARVQIEAEVGARADGAWDAIVCAFGEDEIDLEAHLASWGDALGPHGKIALLLWGPAEPDDPLALIARTLADHPQRTAPDRHALQEMFKSAGLALVRHTLIGHTISFPTVEELVRCTCAAAIWGEAFDAEPDAKKGKLRAKVEGALGGPSAPIAWQPPATLAIGAHPGAEIELPHRPSVKVPASK